MSFSQTNRCILIIDDEPDLCRIVKVTLERFKGWEVFTAESAQVGLTQAQTQQPDAILLDLTLPDGAGLELLTRWRSAGVTLPVIIITARSALDDRLAGPPQQRASL